jgi:hypothetical protein
VSSPKGCQGYSINDCLEFAVFILALSLKLLLTADVTANLLLIPYQQRAKNAGLCGVEVEGGRVPTSDWVLNLQILTSRGYRCGPEPPHH